MPPCPKCGNAEWHRVSGGDSVDDPLSRQIAAFRNWKARAGGLPFVLIQRRLLFWKRRVFDALVEPPQGLDRLRFRDGSRGPRK